MTEAERETGTASGGGEIKTAPLSSGVATVGPTGHRPYQLFWVPYQFYHEIGYSMDMIADMTADGGVVVKQQLLIAS